MSEASLMQVLAQRLSEAQNDKLAIKWQREIEHLNTSPYQDALARFEVPSSAFANMAIYAAHKVRRMIGCYLGIGRADPYTTIIVKNAMMRHGWCLSAGNVIATLDVNAPVSPHDALAHRRVSASGTAQTQASSSKAALSALGAATLVRNGRALDLVLDPYHPIVNRMKEQ